ncbi:MAG: response regulator [Chloroflexi bacterium]|nr:response regulator [Chloroflexota bacterium]
MNKLQGKHIFIVEDNPQNRVIYQVMFLRRSAIVEFERWGNGTVNKLRNLPSVDVIIMDLMLASGASGFEILQEIRQQEKFATVPVVAVSAADPSTTLTRCIEAGFSGFIPKPIDTDRFPDLIVRIIEGDKIWLLSSVSAETASP